MASLSLLMTLLNRSVYICEYIVLKRIFSPLSSKFDCKTAAYVNIKSKELFLLGDRNENIRMKEEQFLLRYIRET